MKSGIRFLCSLAVLFIFAATAFPRDVVTDYDHHANFEKYHTYSWAKVETPNQLWDQRVKDAVDRALQKKGWQKVPEGGDVSLVAVGMTHNKPTLRTFYNGFPGWDWTGFSDATTTVENYKEGTLVLDMFDSQTKKLIWRGSASDILADKPEKNEKKLESAVDKMFDHFPPKPKET
jgi:hypothetical protein